MTAEQKQTAEQAGRETSAVEARQGVISGRVVLVLTTSLCLALVALSVSYCVMH